MSRSYRTRPTAVTAAKKMTSIAGKEAPLPRIIVRQPAPGDIHPLNRRLIVNLLRRLPPQFIYGLKRIELRARMSKEIGRPFAFYRPAEKVIVIYSVPGRVWPLYFGKSDLRTLIRCGAVVHEPDELLWPEDHFLSWFYYSEIMLHEIGHHYGDQYPTKRKPVRGREFSEWQAEAHSFAMWWKLWGKDTPEDEPPAEQESSEQTDPSAISSTAEAAQDCPST